VTLTGLVRAAAERWPDRPALIDGPTGTVTTFAELLAAIPAAAAHLAAAGAAPGTAVGLVGPNSPAWVVALHGALATGAAVAPLNPAGTTGELAAQLDRAGAVAVVADPAVVPRLTGDRPVIAWDELARPSTGTPAPPAELPADDPGAVAVLPFSSGTTGLPKAVRLTHRNLVANLDQHRAVQRLGPGDVLCAIVPFFHSYGLTLVLHNALVHGAALVTLPRFDRDALLDLAATHGITRLHVAPPVLAALDTAPDGAEKALATVQVAVCGAAPLDPVLAERVSRRYGFPVVQGYGMTEASPGTHFTPDDRWTEVPAGSVGWLVPGTEARLEPMDGREDGAGELWLRGPQVTPGYLDDPTATAATLVDGWLRTGDVVTVDDEGRFWVVDRVKELIKYKGYQVAPAELEALLTGHPAVADAAVVGVPDPAAGELPKAYVVPAGALDDGELLAWVAERVAPYKRIRLVEQVDAIPRSPAGKILRRVLRDRRLTAPPGG
jgi:acyl-CoA synthetase (AMP-forming)/AMP-acid ligase II